MQINNVSLSLRAVSPSARLREIASCRIEHTKGSNSYFVFPPLINV